MWGWDVRISNNSYSSVAVLTLIRIFERKILPSSIKRSRRFKVTIYCDLEVVNKIQEYLTSTVEHMDDFSVKKLIENPEKTKVTCTFEHNRKNVMKSLYKKLCDISSPDAVTLQELND